jgi:prophage regulatory protein
MVRRLIKMQDVLSRTSLSRTEIYSRMRQGTFPTAVALGPQRVAWDEAEITSWIDGRVRDRGQNEAWRRRRARMAARARHQGSAAE